MALFIQLVLFFVLSSSTATIDTEPSELIPPHHHHHRHSNVSTVVSSDTSPVDVPRVSAERANSTGKASKFWNQIVPFALSSDVPRAGKKTLYFVHIPKTAGSSMERVLQTLCEQRQPLCLRRFMGSELVKVQRKYKVDLIQSWPENEVCQKHKGDIIFGHMPFDVDYVREVLLSKRPLPPVEPVAQVVQGISTIFPIIMLREPVARVVSFANFLNIPQELFERHPERISCNQQTSMINGVPASGGGCGVGVTSQKKLWSSFAAFNGSCNFDETLAVKEGIRRLSEMFYFVGVAEDFIGSMYLLQRMFGWGTETMTASFEKSMKQFCDGICMKRYQIADLNPKTIDVITKNEYRCDGKLWRYAKSMLEARLAGMSAVDVKQFQLFERMAKAHDKKRDEAIKLATQKTTFKNTRGVLKMTSLSLESLASKEATGSKVMDVNSALRLASAAGMLDRKKAVQSATPANQALSGGASTSSGPIDFSSNSMVNQAIIDSIKSNAKKHPTMYTGTSSSTANHYGVCGANAMLEVFHDQRKGDVCRVLSSREFYCPLGCRIATITPSTLCSENTPEQRPCRHKVVHDASVIKKKRRRRE